MSIIRAFLLSQVLLTLAGPSDFLDLFGFVGAAFVGSTHCVRSIM